MTYLHMQKNRTTLMQSLKEFEEKNSWWHLYWRLLGLCNKPFCISAQKKDRGNFQKLPCCTYTHTLLCRAVSRSKHSVLHQTPLQKHKAIHWHCMTAGVSDSTHNLTLLHVPAKHPGNPTLNARWFLLLNKQIKLLGQMQYFIVGCTLRGNTLSTQNDHYYMAQKLKQFNFLSIWFYCIWQKQSQPGEIIHKDCKWLRWSKLFQSCFCMYSIRMEQLLAYQPLHI